MPHLSPAPLRGAVIGCGQFAQNHLHAWTRVQDVQGLQGVRVVAVCDPDPDRAQATARRFDIPGVYSTLESLLEREKPDFVDIVTQMGTHRALVEQAARAGVDVLCQKPLAGRLEDARAMVHTCEATGVRLLVHENFRFQRAMRLIKQLAPRLGRLFYGRLSFCTRYDIYAHQPYLASDERFILTDVGTHLFDLVRFLMGEVSSLSCHTQRIHPQIRGEDVAHALLKLESGASAALELSYRSSRASDPFPQTLVSLEGERGSVTLEPDGQLTVVLDGATSRLDARPQWQSWFVPPGHFVQDSVLSFQQHALDALCGRVEPETSGWDNLKTLELVEGAYQSASSAEVYRVGSLLGAL